MIKFRCVPWFSTDKTCWTEEGSLWFCRPISPIWACRIKIGSSREDPSVQWFCQDNHHRARWTKLRLNWLWLFSRWRSSTKFPLWRSFKSPSHYFNSWIQLKMALMNGLLIKRTPCFQAGRLLHNSDRLYMVCVWLTIVLSGTWVLDVEFPVNVVVQLEYTVIICRNKLYRVRRTHSKKTVYTIGYISRPPSKKTNTLAARGHRRFPESTSFEKKNRQVATTNCWMVGFVGKRLLLSRC